jgi:hypothetical protein
MAVRRLTKSSQGDMIWKTISSSVKKKKKQDWCVFYTPMGRMVNKPSGKRPRNMHPEDWCADKTPFRGKVVRSY